MANAANRPISAPKGWDGYAMLGQPSKVHPCRVLILFPWCSTTLLAPHIKKLEIYFARSVLISGLSHRDCIMMKTIFRNTVPNGIIHCGSQCTPFQHSAGHISLHHPPAKLPCSYHYHLGNKWFLRPSLRSNLDFPPGGRYYCHPLWIPFRIVYVS